MEEVWDIPTTVPSTQCIHTFRLEAQEPPKFARTPVIDFNCAQGKSLASVTVVGNPDCSDSELEARVRSHLMEWFDAQKGKSDEGGMAGWMSGLPTREADVASWRHLRTYRVPYAQPAQTPPVRDGGFFGRKVQVSEHV